MSQLVGRLSFRVQQLNVKVETKTLDNVFLTAVVSVQYQVLRDKCYEAFYSLTNERQQITSHVYDVMRSQLPTLELDAVFEAKEELALAVKNALADTMTGYGYQIVQVLITDLDPDQRVKVRRFVAAGDLRRRHCRLSFVAAVQNLTQLNSYTLPFLFELPALTNRTR